MATMLDATALYGGRPAANEKQQRQRERMTVAVYNDTRDGRARSTTWAIIAALHILIVFYSFGAFPDFMQDVKANPAPAAGLAVWIICDVIYLCCYPTIHSNYQAVIERLEGKTPPNRR